MGYEEGGDSKKVLHGDGDGDGGEGSVVWAIVPNILQNYVLVLNKKGSE